MRQNLSITDVLDEIEEKDILLYCLNKKLIDEDAVRNALNLDKDKPLPDGDYYVNIDIDEYDVLDNMWSSEIRDYLEDTDDYVILDHWEYEKLTKQEENEDIYSSRHDFINFIKKVLHKHFTACYTKEDVKKAICEMADEELYI